MQQHPCRPAAKQLLVRHRSKQAHDMRDKSGLCWTACCSQHVTFSLKTPSLYASSAGPWNCASCGDSNEPARSRRWDVL